MPRMALRALWIACALCLAASSAQAEETPKAGRHAIPRSSDRPGSGESSSSGPFSMIFGGLGVILAGFGAFVVLAKKTRLESTTANLRVVGRVSLSPRQSVYLLRVGDRTLIVGTGGQGPPSILGEMKASEESEAPAAKPGVLPLRAGGAA